MSKVSARTPQPVALWIVLCAFLNCAGWMLSAFHRLDRAGYAVMFALAVAALGWWMSGRPDICQVAAVRKLRHRFRRGFPLAFLFLAFLAFLGGVIYAPSNYDGLAYRTPRVLHWLAEGRWHWIPTHFHRLNTRRPGYEWLVAPFLFFPPSNRLLFLIDPASLLLLPSCL